MPFVILNGGREINCDEVEVTPEWVVLRHKVTKAEEREVGFWIFKTKKTFLCDRIEPFAFINRDDVVSVHK